MGLLFALTTPIGIAIGIAIASGYDEKSTAALLVSGIFDSISAGILVYMALVDLVATDIASKTLRASVQLQLYYYVALFCGAGAMSLLGYWA
jgi:zinc transporter 1/2/3